MKLTNEQQKNFEGQLKSILYTNELKNVAYSVMGLTATKAVQEVLGHTNNESAKVGDGQEIKYSKVTHNFSPITACTDAVRKVLARDNKVSYNSPFWWLELRQESDLCFIVVEVTTTKEDK